GEKEETHGKEQLEQIADSLKKIVEYSGVDEETAKSFVDSVNAYKNTINKNGTEDDIRKIRNEVTKRFNEVYMTAFLKAAEDIYVPTVLKMFFNFGYVDEELAGIDNAVYLYKLAEDIPSSPDNGVYSIFEWLMAIYEGRKDPGRNEFEVDFADYLHEEMRNKRITKLQEQQAFMDKKLRVQYELENVFPSVNKTTTGRITTFCPLFSEHNVLKSPESMLVTEQKVFEILDGIVAVDYAAYYRQTVFAAPEQGITKEFIDVEVRPDIILAPNIGNRGIMWQEIEGKRRTTPARMFLSIFQQDDLNLQLLRLTGQFRWEMCKRIQGARWNDITERSLTSEYCDYIQYYRKNNDLTPEAKDKLKNDIQRCKNNFREVFIRDYIIWVQFEAQGSPRLNKVSRNIMFTYIPFSAACRDKLKINPMYKDMIERYEIKQKAKLHRLDNMKVKLNNMGKPLPREIQEEMEFIMA
ncbi:MAG: cyclic nucleotide-binding domain-containing protein, partial [Lachnospiraceae bacterium]|nr:cyclic nucleotide-binding domain-containing protein [Lachnospiraceae bacterium]